MTRQRLLIVLLLPVLLMLMGARIVPLVEQSPIAVPAGLGAEQTAKALKSALLGRKWTITGEGAGKIDATLYIRSHVASIAITYDDKEVRFAYVSSENLKYRMREGVPHIHRNYMVWVRDLAAEMSRSMHLLAG